GSGRPVRFPRTVMAELRSLGIARRCPGLGPLAEGLGRAPELVRVQLARVPAVSASGGANDRIRRSRRVAPTRKLLLPRKRVGSTSWEQNRGRDYEQTLFGNALRDTPFRGRPPGRAPGCLTRNPRVRGERAETAFRGVGSQTGVWERDWR